MCATWLAAAMTLGLAGCGSSEVTVPAATVPQDVFAGLSKQPSVYSVFRADDKTRFEAFSRDSRGSWYVIDGSAPYLRWLFVDGQLYRAGTTGWARVNRNSCPEIWGTDGEFAGREEPNLPELARSLGERVMRDLGEVEIEPMYLGLGTVAVGPEGVVRGRRYLLEGGAELRTDGETRWELRKKPGKERTWTSLKIAILDTMPLYAPRVVGSAVSCAGETVPGAATTGR